MANNKNTNAKASLGNVPAVNVSEAVTKPSTKRLSFALRERT